MQVTRPKSGLERLCELLGLPFNGFSPETTRSAIDEAIVEIESLRAQVRTLADTMEKMRR